MDIVESTNKDLVKNVLVWERDYKDDSTGEVPYEMKEKDVRMDLLVADQRPFCAPEPMDAEDTLFILYTSGSTGQPKVSFFSVPVVKLHVIVSSPRCLYPHSSNIFSITS